MQHGRISKEVSYEVRREAPGSQNSSRDSLKDDNADFIIRASEKYGSRAKRQAEKIIRDVQAIYAGGELEERDMDAMMKALQDAYWAAKEINRKYVPKKYREEEGE